MNENKNKSFEITIQLYEELHKYKDLFPNAIVIYFDHAIGKYSCNYTSNNPKKTIRLKITRNHEWYKELLEIIEEKEKENNKKLSRTILLNNIMSTLLGIEQYNR